MAAVSGELSEAAAALSAVGDGECRPAIGNHPQMPSAASMAASGYRGPCADASGGGGRGGQRR